MKTEIIKYLEWVVKGEWDKEQYQERAKELLIEFSSPNVVTTEGHCPTCGSEVEVASADEGTNYYVPKNKSVTTEGVVTDEEIYKMLLIGCKMEVGDLSNEEAIKQVRDLLSSHNLTVNKESGNNEEHF